MARTPPSKSDNDNRSRQLDPEHDAYWRSRGHELGYRELVHRMPGGLRALECQSPHAIDAREAAGRSLVSLPAVTEGVVGKNLQLKQLSARASAARMHEGERDALVGIEAARPAAAARVVQTIGYEGHTLESYLDVLLRAGVTLLCDVRRNPISRKYGFAKSTLARACDEVGLRYEHLPALGIASAQRRGLHAQEAYDALFSDYERTWLPTQPDALAAIVDWTRGGERVALTCYEHDPRRCHRRCVAEALEAMAGKDLAATHL